MIWPRRNQTAVEFPPVVLSGFRVFLRHPQPGDFPQWTDVRGRNEKFLKPYEPAWPENCLSEEFFSRRLLRQARDWKRRRAYSFLIFRNDDCVLIGGVNINNVCHGASQSGTLGYWLDETEQGRGYMAEALRLVIDYGFRHLDLHRFHAGCLVHNDRSASLLLKLGFEEEGFARKYVRIDGKWQDHRLFGLPVEHWDAGESTQQNHDPAKQA